MILIIQIYTNRKANDLQYAACAICSFMSPFTLDEIKAAIGRLLSNGVDKDNLVSVFFKILQMVGLSSSSYILNSFKFFIRAIYFDNYRDHTARLQSDHLAAFCEVWNKLMSNLQRFYVADDTLTVDEQFLVGDRGKIPDRTNIPSKPSKYGIEIFWLCEAEGGFPLNANIEI